MKEAAVSDEQVMAQWFENSYDCPICDTQWTDKWSCMCNDKCPNCNAEIEPFESVDLSRPLTQEDYIGVARLTAASGYTTFSTVTDDQARRYAEAILEGCEHRFELDL
jgi:hypothetical protein